MFEVLERKDGAVTRFRMYMPDDGHQHLRERGMLKLVAPMVAKRFGAAIIMPNLETPITTADMAHDYRADIVEITRESGFYPVMTQYLTDKLEPAEVRLGLIGTWVKGIKYYPPGLTTNSDSGVENPESLWTPGTKPYECLWILAEHGGVFLIHAADGKTRGSWNGRERNYGKGDELDPYDQEQHFLQQTLPHIIDAHPTLKISVEHMSTADGAEEMRYWGKEHAGYIGCSLTAHHLLLDRRDVFRRGINVHRTWMPVIQPMEHRQELRKFAAEDHPFVWLGSDSAPHLRVKKEAACCASGVLMAHAAIELYTEAFEQMGALDERFERFASLNWRKFFGFRDDGRKTIELVREEWMVEQPFFADTVPKGAPPQELTQAVVPFRLGETVQWKLAN